MERLAVNLHVFFFFKDINECEHNNPCRQNQRCLNTVGSYRCVNYLNCGGGFELNEAGTQCVGEYSVCCCQCETLCLKPQ